MSLPTRTLLVLALSAVPALAVDPMVCRQARYDSGTYLSPGLSLSDAFGTVVSMPTQVRQLCDTATVDGVPPSDPTAYLVSHVGKDTPNSGTSTRPDVQITNATGTWQLKLTRNEQLAFDSEVNGASATQPLDSYRCYKSRIIAGQPAWTYPVVTVVDQFEPSHQVQLQKPYKVCEPVSIDGSPIADPAAVLTCYGMKDMSGLSPFPSVAETVENMLGNYTVLVRARPKPQLCLPSAQTILPPA